MRRYGRYGRLYEFDEDIIDENEDEDLDNLPMDEMDLYDILDENGWAVTNVIEGRNYMRFEIDKYPFSKHKAVPVEELIEKIKENAIDPERISLSCGHYRYAPEIKKCSILFDLR